MYKIQVLVVDSNGVWYDMINMPEFRTEADANDWLAEKNVNAVSALMDFRVVPASVMALPFSA